MRDGKVPNQIKVFDRKQLGQEMLLPWYQRCHVIRKLPKKKANGQLDNDGQGSLWQQTSEIICLARERCQICLGDKRCIVVDAVQVFSSVAV